LNLHEVFRDAMMEHLNWMPGPQGLCSISCLHQRANTNAVMMKTPSLVGKIVGVSVHQQSEPRVDAVNFQMPFFEQIVFVLGHHAKLEL